MWNFLFFIPHNYKHNKLQCETSVLTKKLLKLILEIIMFSRCKVALRNKQLTCRFLSDSSIKVDNIAPPDNAKVVICGGGVMGASVAYHLGKIGWGSETILIEQSRWDLYKVYK